MKDYRLKKDGMQWRFNKSRAKIQIISGGFGNGKTTACCIKGLQCAVDYPGSEGLMARETYPKLNDTLRKEFMKWTPPHWVKKWPTQEDNSLFFKNGSIIHFRYIAQKGKSQEDGSTTSNLLSAAYDWAIVDQIEDPGITYKDFLDILGRVRGQTPYQGEDDSMPASGPRFFMITLNPARTWIYKRVIYPYIQWRDHSIRMPDLIIDPDTMEPLVELFEGSTYENQDNLPKDYIRTMEAAYKGQMAERYIHGRYAAFEGLVYSSFDPRIHLLHRQQAEAHLEDCLSRHVKVRAIEGYDFGLISPTCYLLGFVDDFGRLVILDGFHRANFDYNEHPAAIREIRNRYIGRLEVTRQIIADPAIFKKQVVAGHGQVSSSLAELLRKMGIHTTPGDNEITSGIAKVSSYLGGHDKVPHIVTHTAPGPLLYVVNDLNFFEDEIGSYYWKKNPLGQSIDEPQDGGDHSLDTIKYMLSKLPDASAVKLPMEKQPKPYLLWHEMEQSDYKRASRL